MASIGLYEAFIAFFCLFTFYFFFHTKPFCCLLIQKTHKSYPWNWPVLGMLPGVLLRLHHIYDYSVEVLECSNLTFQFKGPWFAGMDTLVTVDSANIHYMLTSNFSNYIKGPEFHEIFEVFGDGIVNSDSDLWRNLRKLSQATFNHQGFQNFSTFTTRSKLTDGLVPLLNHFAEEEMVVDLQDVFQRFMFDTTYIFLTGSDPRSLSIEMPEAEFAKAFDDIGEAVVYRHIAPRFLWNLQKWIGIGTEKNMMEANATLDRVCTKFISSKREEIRSQGITRSQGDCKDLLTYHIKLDTNKYELLNPEDDKFLRDYAVGIMAAGRDSTAATLTWFFWILSENPNVLTKILQEMNTNLPKKGNGQDKSSYMNKLVYLHAALSESLRLYPPIPFERKSPIKPDVLPSGHKVKSNTNIMIFIYALGRMKAIWGEDAIDFKPERWISETGELKHEPSFKFLSFMAGPRTCLGKNLAMNLMKTVIVEILQNYEIRVISGQKIEPKPGLILQMKHGLKATIAKKCSSLD
ncbi:hypothetical protein EUTSA_v10027722mg [Eutrema salsugineum]|uniref:Cytochrome P450 n=1 Tax=Eutrema salsugineum TaxID=72664 RepID=V4M3I4_EUTSA|nr:alkane hydroxylase MAH1 [Eutrema salsugineum]ESQ46803.1 hypothetical protein EUTSA_v10027722mg [Eutrema salsugineum]